MNTLNEEENVKTIKDYFNLIVNNKIIIILITSASLIVSIIYAVSLLNIYESTTLIKISQPQGNILSSSFLPELKGFADDRFISNEIEILKSNNIREKVANRLIADFNAFNQPDSFYLVLDRNEENGDKSGTLLTSYEIQKVLEGNVKIDQKRGLDIVTITAQSPSPYEAKLIANTYALEYKKFNLETSRSQLTIVKNFLKKQSEEKFVNLKKAEDKLQNYQQKEGIISLGEQTQALIDNLSQFEAQMNSTQIQLLASDKVLMQLKNEIAKQNPRINDYLKSVSSEASFTAIQNQLAELEVKRDLALVNGKKNIANSDFFKKYDLRIKELKDQLKKKVNIIKAGIFASSPEEVKELSMKVLEEEVNNLSLRISLKKLKKIVTKYSSEFNKLPESAITYARLKRKLDAYQKLYLLIEEKYQEALINEQAQPGNVLIIDSARRSFKPAKPNRKLIVMVGLMLGFGISFGFVFVRDHLDTTIKTPEDIQNKNINVLAWIPPIGGPELKGKKEYEFIVAKKKDASASEAFRALRTRIQFAKISAESLKTILVTSSVPQEGKTVVSINIAGTFALSDKKTLVLDADFRKPRIHSVLKENKYPGFTDYLFGNASLNEVLRKTELPNLFAIPSGTIPPNPSEIIASQKMKKVLEDFKNKFDVIVIDSPPIVAVTDSEILSTMVDATIVVALTEKTDLDLLQKSVELVKANSSSFIGCVLNNFSYKSGYGAYYKYYYYYTQQTNGNSKKHNKKLS